MDLETRQKLFKKVYNFFEIPMLVITLLLLVVIVIPEIFSLSDHWLQVLEIIDWFVWAAFVIELITLTYLAEKRLKHLKKSWLDVIIVVVPMLRFARFLRVARFARVARVGRATRVARITRATRLARLLPLAAIAWQKIKEFFTKHKLNYVLFFALGIIFAFGTLGALAERNHPDANITNIYEGIWWAFVSMTTVGYGDRYPVTPAGRAIGIVIMVLGITTFSILTANVASFLVEEGEKDEQKEVKDQLNRLEKKLDKVLKRDSVSKT